MVRGPIPGFSMIGCFLIKLSHNQRNLAIYHQHRTPGKAAHVVNGTPELFAQVQPYKNIIVESLHTHVNYKQVPLRSEGIFCHRLHLNGGDLDGIYCIICVYIYL